MRNFHQRRASERIHKTNRRHIQASMTRSSGRKFEAENTTRATKQAFRSCLLLGYKSFRASALAEIKRKTKKNRQKNEHDVSRRTVTISRVITKNAKGVTQLLGKSCQTKYTSARSTPPTLTSCQGGLRQQVYKNSKEIPTVRAATAVNREQRPHGQPEAMYMPTRSAIFT